MFIVDIRFSHGAEPILIMRVAYTHIVSIGSAACQEPLETMSEATPLHVRKGPRRSLDSRMLEDEADKDVVDGYGDGIDTHGSHGGA